ncbi:MAG TPA: glutathione-disulfide reductase, partial [Candidatus Binatia bacterium]|nr:glutathione-disulfide reductase [Candidatus Binatia bacterium]
NVGCIPKKLLVYASEFADDFEDAHGFGWAVGKRQFDWPELISGKDREIERLNGVYRRLLESAGARLVEGHATVVDAHTVAIGGRHYTTRTILIATGGWPWKPAIPGAENAITSNEAFHLERLPRRVLIVGGGYIAVEFAGIFKGLGAEVILAYRGPLFLRGFDDDLRAALAVEMRKRGIDLRFDTTIEAIERVDGSLRARLSGGRTLDADQVMLATGRTPNTRGIGLEEAGVELDRVGAIRVDPLSRSSVPSIYAIGDCTNRMNLTPVAIAEARAFVETAFRQNPTPTDYRDVPTAVFSQPSLGTVGLTEAEARERFPAIDVYRSTFRPLKHTLSGRDEETLMKLVVDRESDRVLGCHMIGPDAGEVIQGFAVALRCNATKAQFDATVGIHPTAAEEFVTMREKAVERR